MWIVQWNYITNIPISPTNQFENRVQVPEDRRLKEVKCALRVTLKGQESLNVNKWKKCSRKVLLTFALYTGVMTAITAEEVLSLHFSHFDK